MNQQPNIQKILNKAAPFGYQWLDDRLVPDAQEAAIRKLMYELFLHHRRKKTVARLLNEAGYRTRSGAKFSDMTVERLLRDASAKGVYQVYHQNRRQGKNKPDEIAIEPIVSTGLWEQVNVLLNGSHKLAKKAVQLFANLIYCECGARMSVPSNSAKYVCSDCRHKIGTVDLEEIFQEQLQSLAFPSNPKQAQAPSDYWQDLTRDEKRLIIEQLVDRIIIGKTQIHIELYQLNPLKMVTDGQQLTREQHGSADAEEVKAEPAISTLTEPLLNETQAAKFLGVSRMTLLRKRNNGEINFFRVGFRVLYSKEKHLLPFLQLCEKRQ